MIIYLPLSSTTLFLLWYVSLCTTIQLYNDSLYLSLSLTSFLSSTLLWHSGISVLLSLSLNCISLVVLFWSLVVQTLLNWNSLSFPSTDSFSLIIIIICSIFNFLSHYTHSNWILYFSNFKIYKWIQNTGTSKSTRFGRFDKYIVPYCQNLGYKKSHKYWNKINYIFLIHN